MSIVQPYKDRMDTRCKERVPFAVVGCIMYCILYFILPKNFTSLIGMLGGIMVGFSATYKWQTVFNTFGGLSSAVSILGLEVAIIFRIVNNVFGAIYGRLFSKIFDKVEEKITNRSIIEEMTTSDEL